MKNKNNTIIKHLRKILLAFVPLCLLTLHTAAQRPTYMLADSVVMYSNSTKGATLIIKSNTKDTTGGFLYNTGNGVTIFKKALTKINDSTYLVGPDTLKIRGGGGGSTDTTYLSNRIDLKQNTTDTTLFDATKTDVARGIKDSLLNQDLQRVLDRGNTANSNIFIDRPRSQTSLTGNSSVTSFNIYDNLNASFTEMALDATEASIRAHASSATEGGVVVNDTRGRIYMGTPNDQLTMRIDSDTNRVSIQQINGNIRGSGSLKVNFPITQDIWSNNYVQDLQAKSGTISLLSDITDAFDLNKLYIQYGYGAGDSVVYFPNDSTLRAKDLVLGYGLSPHARTDTTTGVMVDTSLISTKANTQKIVNDSSAVLRALSVPASKSNA